jgi:predicted RNA-binding Zn-ribbon protein involved in translation (DUF1610 family)
MANSTKECKWLGCLIHTREDYDTEVKCPGCGIILMVPAVLSELTYYQCMGCGYHIEVEKERSKVDA